MAVEGQPAEVAGVEGGLEPINVGIIGCGHVSHQYLNGCGRFGILRVRACADIDHSRAQELARRHGVPRACSPAEVIADPDIHLLINLTPPLAHAATSIRAVEGGKHVWSEKPLGSTLEEGAAVVATAKEAGTLLGCAPDTFLGGSLQTCRKLIDDGWIGDPVAAVAFVSEHGYEHFHPNVDFFYGPGGGPLLDLGPYYVTALVSMLGPVAEVSGLARATFPERTIRTGKRQGEKIAVRVPTHVTGALELTSGLPVTFLSSWDIWSTHLPYLEIYGTAGSLAVPNPDEFTGVPRLRRAGDDELSEPPPPPGALPWADIPLTHDGTVGRGIGVADMAYALRTGRPHRASGELAFHVLEVLLALELSSIERRHVAVESECQRPAPLPAGLTKGKLDGPCRSASS